MIHANKLHIKSKTFINLKSPHCLSEQTGILVCYVAHRTKLCCNLYRHQWSMWKASTGACERWILVATVHNIQCCGRNIYKCVKRHGLRSVNYRASYMVTACWSRNYCHMVIGDDDPSTDVENVVCHIKGQFGRYNDRCYKFIYWLGA